MPPDLQYCAMRQVIGPHKGLVRPECIAIYHPATRSAAHRRGVLTAKTRMIVSPESLVELKGGDGHREGRDGADVCPRRSSRTGWTILAQWDDGLDNGSRSPDRWRAVPRSARRWTPAFLPARTRRADASDVAADEIEHQIDDADVFQGVVLEVDELARAEVERLLTAAARPVPMT